MGLAELSSILWAERRLLELLVFKLESQQLLLGSGRDRWLPRSSDELEAVLEDLRHTEVLRAMEARAVATELGLAAVGARTSQVEQHQQRVEAAIVDSTNGLATVESIDLPALTFPTGLVGFAGPQRFHLVRWGGEDSPSSTTTPSPPSARTRRRTCSSWSSSASPTTPATPPPTSSAPSSSTSGRAEASRPSWTPGAGPHVGPWPSPPQPPDRQLAARAHWQPRKPVTAVLAASSPAGRAAACRRPRLDVCPARGAGRASTEGAIGARAHEAGEPEHRHRR